MTLSFSLPKPPPPNIQWKELDLKTLKVDASWQKERFNQRFANRLTNGFNPALCHSLGVAIDSRGDYQLWAGQHRRAALLQLGYDRWMCMIVHADTAEQARLFVDEATRLGITGSHRHSASVYFDKDERDIDGIIRNHGFVLSPGQDNSIRAVSQIRKIYQRAGGDVLNRTIDIAKQAWPGDKAGRADIILDGISTFIQAYDGLVNDQIIIGILKTFDAPAFAASANRMCPRIKKGGITVPAKQHESFALYLARQYGRAVPTTKLHSKRVAEANRSIKNP